MPELSAGLITLIMFITALVLVFSGAGIGFALGLSGVIVGFFLWGQHSWDLVITSTLSQMQSFALVAALCFIFMAMVLEKAGIAESLFAAMHAWFGPVNGGLAIGTIVICTLFAAMSGVSATGTMTMGIIALPVMRKFGYSKEIALGPIAAGGALGVLIPPSVMMIVYGLISAQSIARIFMGGMGAGLVLSALFIIYIFIRCKINPSLAPALPAEERPSFSRKLKMTSGLVLPLLLIIAVLGSIFAGIATPTEAAGIGAIGAVICTIVNRRFTWKGLWQSGLASMRLMAAVFWILLGASIFACVYNALGGKEVMIETLGGFISQPTLLLILFMVFFFIMGCLMESIAIIVIFTPVILPIVEILGWDPIWFCIIFMVNLQMGFLTPPFGFNLFYLRAVAPPDINTMDIYRSIIPFVMLQAIGLVLVIFIPEIATWLPNRLLGS